MDLRRRGLMLPAIIYLNRHTAHCERLGARLRVATTRIPKIPCLLLPWLVRLGALGRVCRAPPTLAVSVRASYPHRLGDGSNLGPCPRIGHLGISTRRSRAHVYPTVRTVGGARATRGRGRTSNVGASNPPAWRLTRPPTTERVPFPGDLGVASHCPTPCQGCGSFPKRLPV
jgi:hypothetical protein